MVVNHGFDLGQILKFVCDKWTEISAGRFFTVRKSWSLCGLQKHTRISLTKPKPMIKYYAIALANYANFRGRAGRSEFWYFVLLNTFLSLLVMYVSKALNHNLLPQVLALLLVLPVMTVAVRRMHDRGKSGWYALIPLYNLVLACLPGEPHDNRYGANRKEP